MIVIETVVINDKHFVKTYSNENKYIECDGTRYSEAFDLAAIEKVYTETDIDIETDSTETTETDYIKVLEELKSLKEKANAYDILTGVSE